MQSHAIYVEKVIFKISVHILEEDASSVQVGLLNM
jgi:hypothetical protein